MTEALLPCPFCGEAPEENGHGLIDCVSPDCTANVRVLIPNDRATAVAAWNQRPPWPHTSGCPDCTVASEEDGAARERAAVVAWLRTEIDRYAEMERWNGRDPDARIRIALGHAADRIERGEHLPAKEPGT